MNAFERWFVRGVIRREVRQGYDHPQRIAGLFAMIVSAARDEFREDNEPTARFYLTEWFEDGFRAALAREGR